MTDRLLDRLRAAVDSLPAGLRDHVLRVETEAVALAERQGIDPYRARVAALGHDLLRAERPERLLQLAGVQADEVEQAAPILLHGPLAARLLRDHYDVDDEEALLAAARHTTAAPGMSMLEKVLFLADKVEEDKLRRRPQWREVRDLAQRDLDAALLRFLGLQIEYAIERGWRIHPRTILARNELLPPDAGGD